MKSILEQYRIADFLEWSNNELLELNPDFQRRDVWMSPVRTYLIDTILRGYPIPKIYMRTRIDPQKKIAKREIVDGQQRMRAILDFANGGLRLSKNAGEFGGMVYSSLDEAQQSEFLEYPIAVDQLTTADDEEVLEVFARLNSSDMRLNAAEKRHARFQSEFKLMVCKSSRKWKTLWEDYGVLSLRQRARMEDDSLMAEMYSVLVNGVTDGGATKIDGFYSKMNNASGNDLIKLSRKIDKVLGYFVDNFANSIKNTRLMKAPHFLMLFAALTHALIGIPRGDLKKTIPSRQSALSNLDAAQNALHVLAEILELSALPAPEHQQFWEASRGTTQRIKSREPRFFQYFEALSAR